MRLSFLFIMLLSTYLLLAQEKIEINGAITLSNSEALNPTVGTIRWNGCDFEGFNGFFWVPLSRQSLGSVSDRQGNAYKTYVIGNREWMVENLRSTVFNDSTPIPEVKDTVAWGLLGDAAFCWYANDQISHESPYGALYNWYAVDHGDLCPVGWQVPDDNDFEDLIQEAQTHGAFDLGRAALQTTGNIDDGSGLWPANVQGTNKTGWSAEPAGRRRDDGIFEALNVTANFWSSVETGVNTAEHRFLSTGLFFLTPTSTDKNRGSSIRCVKIPPP